MSAKQRFVGQTVLVTGASRGIGRAAAIALAREGAYVVLAARDRQRLASALAEAGAGEVLVMDVASDASVEAGVRKLVATGRVPDLIINNAGIYEQVPFMEQDPAQQRREMEVNYFGAVRLTRALVPAMIARGGGTVVNVSSLVGAIPCPGVANYGATKAALNAWTWALRHELGRHGIRMVVYMPSHTATENALKTRYTGVKTLSVDLAVRELLRAAHRAPRSYAASPVFRSFLRLAGIFPAWAGRRMKACTDWLFEGQSSPRLPAPLRRQVGDPAPPGPARRA